MSANGKRVLPTTAASTAALVPFSQPGYAAGQPGRSGDNDDLIDQLVGGLVQADRSTKSEANFFNQREDSSSYGRTYSIDDEEIDEPPVPIPSTWQAQSATKEPSWLAEQLKASVYGFIIGLFVVIPAVMLLTGQTERLPSWSTVSQYASTTAAEFGIKLNLGGETSVAATAPRVETPSAAASPSETTTQTAPAATAEKTPTETVATAPVAEKPSASEAVVTPSATAATAPSQAETNSADTQTQTTTEPQQTAALAQPQSPEPASPAAAQPTIASPALPSTATAPVQSESNATDQSVDDPAAPPPAAPAATQAEAAEMEPATPRAALTDKETAALTDSLANSFVDQGRQAAAAPTNNQSNDSQTATGQSSGPAADPMPDALTIETARFLMKNGKMEDGREILAKLASRGNAGAIFSLAESFDPNVLAAWGASGVAAEPEKAKIFYSMALSQGVEAAIPRLKGLE